MLLKPPAPLPLLAALALAACQAAPAAQTSASAPLHLGRTTPIAKSTSQKPDAPPAIGAYTHDAAERLFRAAKYSEDEALCQQTVTAIERSKNGGKGPNDPQLADPLNDLATVYLRIGRFEDARKLIDRAEPLLNPTVHWQALVLARVETNKAWRSYAWGETGLADKSFSDARDLLQKNGAADSLDMAEVLNDLGLVMEDGNDKVQAQGRRLLYQAWEMRRRLAGDLSPECEESLSNLGMNLLFHGNSPDDAKLAIASLHKAYDTAQKLWGPDHPETAMALANIAMADQMTDQNDKAADEIRQALAVTTKVFGPMSLDRASELQILGSVLQAQEKFPDAEAAFKEAVSINESVYGPTHPFVGSALTYLEGLYDAMHDDAKSEEIKERADKLRGLDL
ncbi:MAG TPA: tetratricopeptide repeat protein [Phycisphaerae bacterium]|nr:tetratricopeptide repeat protein [Phycisphaerae bacterium]